MKEDTMAVQAAQSSDVMLQKDGTPWPTARQAHDQAQKQGLDRDDYEVRKTEDGTGFAIYLAAMADHAGEAEPEVVPTPKERVFWVRFQEKSNPNDTEDVILSVNGEILHIRRNQRVPVPERFLEAADNARYPRYQQRPGELRKIVGYVRTYPYERIEEATWDDYWQTRASGTEQNRKYLEEHGMEKPRE